jgi:phosphoribosyl 1,2-cyclic phosphodiesterase
MIVSISSLNSGSNGNCYYVGTDHEAILVDAGLSCRETEKRMDALGLSLENVKAIFISHEHIDHIKGLPVLSGKYQIPVYISDQTLNQLPFTLSKEVVRILSPGITMNVGNLSVVPFLKEHDAIDPVSFIININGVNIGVFTDIGRPCKSLKHYFNRCHAAFLEANYDRQMLENGNYPKYLKNRIRNGSGHLSNDQALEIFNKHRSPYLSHLFLSHLSHENNCTELVKELFDRHSKNVEVIIASRYRQTEVYRINASNIVKQSLSAYSTSIPVQMQLF